MADKTLLDSDPAPTRRDETATAPPSATLLDGGPAATRLDKVPAGTRRADARPVPRRSIFNLPQALDARYRIIEPLPTAGAEAELLIVESTENRQRVVAKLYRPGIRSKTEVLERIGGFMMVVTAVFKSFWLFAAGILAVIGSFAWFGWLRWRANGQLRVLIRRLPRPSRTVAGSDAALDEGRAA